MTKALLIALPISAALWWLVYVLVDMGVRAL